MTKKYRVVLPGNELIKMKLGFYIYSDKKTLIVEAESMYDVYSKYPKAFNIKELREYDYLNNSVLYFDKKNV